MRALIAPILTLAIAAGPALAAEEQSSDENVAVTACKQHLREVSDQRSAKLSRYAALSAQQIHTLREAALVFARAGDVEGCEMIADRLAERLESAEEEYDEAQERRRIEDAKPFPETPHALRARDVIGAEVIRTPDKEIGTVEDVLVSSDDRQYLVVSEGGFLGVGEDEVPIPLQRVRVTDDANTLVLDIDEEKLEEAPDMGDRPEDVDLGNWLAEVDNWWNQAMQK
jgi:sporulation protein YlmC with PRC-barrel domain